MKYIKKAEKSERTSRLFASNSYQLCYYQKN